MSYFYKTGKMKKDMIPFSANQEFEFRPGLNLLVGDQGCGKSTLIQMLMYHKEFNVKVDPKHYQRSTAEGAAYDYTKGKNIQKERHVKQEFADAFSTESTENPVGDYVFFDTEKHNPRILQGDQGSRGELAIVREFLNFAAERIDDDKFIENLSNIAPIYGESIRREAMSEAELLQTRMKSHGQVIYPMLKTISEKHNGLVFLDEPETSLSIRSQRKLVDVLYQATAQGCQLFIATHSLILIESVEEVYSLEHLKWMPSKDFIDTQV